MVLLLVRVSPGDWPLTSLRTGGARYDTRAHTIFGHAALAESGRRVGR